METENIKRLCAEKAEELLTKYFGNIENEAAKERPETIGEYGQDLPMKIETEYRTFLADLWAEIAPNDTRSIDDILDEKQLRDVMTAEDKERVARAYAEAQRQTLWERITKTNHRDVTFYKGLLKEYTKELLFCMRHDFLEEATGQEIKNKAF